MTTTSKKGGKKGEVKVEDAKITSLATIEVEVKPFETEIVGFRTSAESLVIKSQKDYETASDFLDRVNKTKKSTDEMRKFFTAPLNLQVDNINALFMPKVKEAESIVQIIKGKMAVFFNEEEKKRVAEQARLDKIRDDANAKRIAEGKEEIAEPVREVAMPTRTVSTGASKAQVRKVWTHEIEHLDQLPEEIKKAIIGEAWKKGIAKSVVQKFVDAGMREITGVRDRKTSCRERV